MMIDKRRDLLKIRVELMGILPPIWREILVPARYSFWDLHVAIQNAMGWRDYHLHEFRFGGSSRDDALLFGIPADEIWDDCQDVQPGWDVPVMDFLSGPGDRAQYEYDFVDGWIHEITLLGVEPRETGQRYPKCVKGERACPPEDCGGVHGYQSLLEILFDPSHPEYQSMSQWIPGGWGPELFKPEQVRFDNPLKRWEKAFSEAGR
jgi:Plasmid pRiA4b ORF-3-like protein